MITQQLQVLQPVTLTELTSQCESKDEQMNSLNVLGIISSILAHLGNANRAKLPSQTGTTDQHASIYLQICVL